MKCTKCGHKLRIGDEFCSKCGTPIEPDIIYNENDVREGRSRKDDTRTYKTDDDHHKKRQHYNDNTQENEHDITGEIDWDYEDSTTKKASKWTSKGIAAAIGIAVAFVVAIVALNVHNMFKTDESVDLGELETTTSQQIKETTTETMTRETTTEAATEETTESGSRFRNPFDGLLNSGEDNSSGSSDESSQDSGNRSKNPFEELLDNGQEDSSGWNEYGEDGGISPEYYDEEDFNENGSSSDYYGRDTYGENNSSSDHYGSDTYDEDGPFSDYYDESYDYGSGVRDFFEGIGGRIKDGVDSLKDRIWED